MNCRDVFRLLDAHVDGELDLAHALALEAHVGACTRCRSREAEVRALREVVRRHTAVERAPAALQARIEHACATPAAGAFRSRRRLALAIPAAAVLGFAAGVMIARPDTEHASAHGVSKIVYHIASSQHAEAALRNLANHLEAAPEVKVVVVAHNDGVDFLLRGARDGGGRLYEAAVQKFNELGVEFRVCGNTLVRRRIDTSNVIPEAVLVPSGIAEISRLQIEEGYAYMKL
jgi:intracellular sulfur oxidation DsrE/DsrF family protein